MRTNYVLCIFSIVSSLLVFFYFTFRQEIKQEMKFSKEPLIKEALYQSNAKDNKNREDSDRWFQSKIKIAYTNPSATLKIINDKIINSYDFRYFLLNFIKISEEATVEILSQGQILNSDLNSTELLSSLFYTKHYDDHIIVIKGITNKKSMLLRLAIKKGLEAFYNDTEKSFLAIPEIKEIANRIKSLNLKEISLNKRTYKEGLNGVTNFEEIRLKSEIKVLQDSNNKLLNIKKELGQIGKDAKFEDFMHIDYIKTYGKIMDYHNLLLQINQKTNDEGIDTSVRDTLNKNKSKIALLLKKEYDSAVENLISVIKENNSRISDLINRLNSKLSDNDHEEDFKKERILSKRIKSALVKLRAEYKEKLDHWNNSKVQIQFLIE